MGFQLIKVAYWYHFTSTLHLLIPGKLALSLRPGLFRGMPTRQRVAALGISSNLSSDAETDFAPAHLRQTDCTSAAILFVGLTKLSVANFVERPRQITVPLEGVHREVEVSVKDKRIFIGHCFRSAKQQSKPQVNGRIIGL